MIENNTIREIVACGICLGPDSPKDFTIQGNTISSCGHEGIDAGTNAQVTITGNTFSNNRGKFVEDPKSIGGNGVVLNASKSTVSANTFINNNAGINCVTKGSNTIGTNTFTGNDDNLLGASECY